MNPEAPSGMRVQKYMSQAGAASRREAEVMIREGRVTINGEPVSVMGARVIPGSDVVSLDGRIVEPAPRRWIVLHKPVGALCTRSDPHGGRTVYDLLPSWAGGLRYVGRLDRDTSGLLLMTNEGDLAAALAHPSGRIEREYRARIAARVNSRTLKQLKRGVELEDGFARPARVRRFEWGEDEPGIRIVLAEGRKREVRRLLRAVGHPPRSLTRTRFGPFRLGGLKPGAWRPALSAELAEARALVARRVPKGRRRGLRRKGDPRV